MNSSVATSHAILSRPHLFAQIKTVKYTADDQNRMSLGSVLSDILTSFKCLAQSNEVPLKTIVAALLLYGVKEFLNDVVFSCPERYFKIYASLFIFGPSIFLLCLSLLASSSFWRVVTGCCLLKWREKRLLLMSTKNSVFVACMPPLIWLMYAFVEEDYYICAKLGPVSAALAEARTNAEKDSINKKIAEARTVSQLIAWGLLLGLVVAATLFVTVYRVCMPIDPKLLGRHAFDEYKADKAVSLFNAKIQPLAEEDATQLVEGLFEKYKDRQHNDQINLIEDELKARFPRHAGNLNAPFRADCETTKPDESSLCASGTGDSAMSQTTTREKPAEVFELKPLINT